MEILIFAGIGAAVAALSYCVASIVKKRVQSKNKDKKDKE